MDSSTSYDTKEQIRQAVDLVDLVGGYIELRRQGRGYVGLCPWHDDTRPSLQVNPERQSWKCWVCDVGGDVFSFVQQREGIGFREALAMLADRAGIELHSNLGQVRVAPGSPDDKRTLYKAMDWARQQYHDCLLRSAEAQTARDYLQGRHVSAESIAQYAIGYSPNEWQWILDRARSTPYSPEVLSAVGLVAKSPNSGRLYDRFRGRVIFPIRDTQRRTIALGGRILPQLADEKSAKYINSPETRLFSKSDQLYGLDIVRDAVAKSRSVVVMEGYTDVVMASQFGLDNVVAVLGTALGLGHIRLLRRFSDTITLVLDGDEAGQRRTNEILELFIAQQVDLRIVTLPAGLDPCDFLLEQGADAMRQLLDGAVDALEHKIRTVMRGFDPARDTHQANQALTDVLSTLAKAPVLQSSTTGTILLRREQVLNRLAREFHVPEPQIREQLSALRRSSSSRSGPSAKAETASLSTASIEILEWDVLELLAIYGETAPLLVESIGREDISSDAVRRLFDTYRKLTEANGPTDFDRVMTELEDPVIKSLLVLAQERANEKPIADPQAQAQDVIDAFAQRREERERRRTTATLEDRNLDEKGENEILEQLARELEQRQGISAPKDG